MKTWFWTGNQGKSNLSISAAERYSKKPLTETFRALPNFTHQSGSRARFTTRGIYSTNIQNSFTNLRILFKILEVFGTIFEIKWKIFLQVFLKKKQNLINFLDLLRPGLLEFFYTIWSVEKSLSKAKKKLLQISCISRYDFETRYEFLFQIHN